MASPYEDRPSGKLRAVSPDDDNDLPEGETRGLYVGTAGNVSITDSTRTTVTIVGASAGQILPVKVVRVRNTSTTASDILALY